MNVPNMKPTRPSSSVLPAAQLPITLGIATIKNNIDHIAHFHTAGVPGRHELDENQEIYYPAVMRAIVETGYKGYVAHEYTPTRDAVKSLVQAVQACDV